MYPLEPAPTRKSTITRFAASITAAFILAFTVVVGGANAGVKPNSPGGETPGMTMASGFGGVATIGDGEIFVGSAPIGWPTGAEPPNTVNRFVKNASGQWTEVSGLSASDGKVGDDFGRSLAYATIRGTATLFVGAPGAGKAYVFQKEGDNWKEVATLTPSSLPEGTEFGGSYERGGLRTGNIAVAGDRVAITAYGADASMNAVYVFRSRAGSWREEAVLKPTMHGGMDVMADSADGEGDGGAAGFAYAVAGAENTLFVSANAANERKGSVLVFSLTSDGWMQTGVLAPDDLTERASFGQALAFDKSTKTLYAGASAMNGTGVVLTYVSTGSGDWVESMRIEQPEPAMDSDKKHSAFGAVLAVSNGRVLIGSRGAAFAATTKLTGSMAPTLTILTPPDERSRDAFGYGLAIEGNVAVVGSPSADYDEGLTTVYEAQPDGTTWQWNPGSMLTTEVSYIESIAGDQVDCEDGTAAVFECSNVDLLSFMSTSELTSHRGVKLNDLWGWEDPVTGKEWVIQGRNDGTAFVDISDPGNPVYVGQLYRTEGSPGSVWRDIKVYKDHAYIVADGAGEHGVQIFDLTQLRDVDPASMPKTFSETAHYDGTASTHNIVINEETGFAYLVGNRSGGKNLCGGQLHIFDIRNPEQPKFAGCFSEGQGGTHDAQCVIYRGADADYNGHEICFASNGSSFVIGDVTNKDSTVTIAKTSYPNQAYTHQGWLSEDNNYFYMNDELDEMYGNVDNTRTLIWDVSDLDDPQLVKEFSLSTHTSDHNLYIRGHFMYQSNYQSGLRILDISDPLNPVEVGDFDTAPYAEDAAGFGGSWSNYPYFKSGVIAVSSGAEGLFILKKRTVDL